MSSPQVSASGESQKGKDQFDSDLESLLDITTERNKHKQLVSDLASGKVLGSRREDFYGADSSSEEGENQFDDYQEALRLQKLRAQKLKTVIKEQSKEPSKVEKKEQSQKVDRKSKLQQLLESEESQEEQEGPQEVVLKDPEQFGLIHSELTQCVQELEQVIKPLLSREQGLDQKEESYCHVKKQLTECYMTNLLFYILAEMRKVNTKDHPVVLRLAYLKSMMKQLQPLDQDLYNKLEENEEDEKEKEPSESESDQKKSQEYYSANQGLPQEEQEEQEEEEEEEEEEDEGSQSVDLEQLHKALRDQNAEEDLKIEEKGPQIRPGKKLLTTRKAAIKSKEEEESSGDQVIRPPKKKKRKTQIGEQSTSQDTKFYKQVEANLRENKKERKEKKQKRKEEIQNELIQKHSINQRNINYRMLKNKGLTRKRKREDRNPRVKLRHKFQRAEKKRKHIVKEAMANKGVYEGEKTGLRSTVVRSRVL